MKNNKKKCKYIKNRCAMLHPKINVGGMQWEFHKLDDDYWPSVPHGHSMDGKYKLELWNGNIYNVNTREIVNHADKKALKALRNYSGFMDFVDKCREEYKQRNPSINIKELSPIRQKDIIDLIDEHSSDKKCKKKCAIIGKAFKSMDKDKYIFFLQNEGERRLINCGHFKDKKR